GASTVQTRVILARCSHSFSYGCPGVGAPDQGVIYEGIGSVKDFLGHTCACTPKSAPFRSRGKSVAHRRPRLVSNRCWWTRSDPTIYSVITSTMIMTSPFRERGAQSV